MQHKTKSILEELDGLYQEKYEQRDKKYLAESRASHAIANAIRVLEQFEEAYSAEDAENLKRKMLNAIRDKDPSKFIRSVRKTNAK